jgi:hypothetical protein
MRCRARVERLERSYRLDRDHCLHCPPLQIIAYRQASSTREPVLKAGQVARPLHTLRPAG